MKLYDFVFVYEVKNRELESVCLLKYELEKRGYSVKIIETWNEVYYRHKSTNARVTVAFALYGDGVLHFVDSFVNNCNKFVNMQWEQLRSESIIEADNSSLGITGIPQMAQHISWGEMNKEWLVNQYGVPEQNVHVVGNITLDFCRSELRNYYLSRKELFNKYHIPEDKKVCCFISSFTTQNLPALIKEESLNLDCGWDFNAAQKDEAFSQKRILEWIERALEDDKELFFIYRPHPAELCNDELNQIEKRQLRFRVIKDETVKQWILTVDKLFVWISTSIAEIYATGKTCGILRPVEISAAMSLEIYDDSRVIQSYEEFKDNIYNDYSFPLNTGILKKHYEIDEACASYKKICDLLEHIYATPKLSLCFEHKNLYTTFRKCFRYNIGNIVKRFLYLLPLPEHLIVVMGKKNRFMQSYNKYKENYFYERQMKKNNHSTHREIKNIVKRIGYALAEDIK